jgi:hypothetical protein
MLSYRLFLWAEDIYVSHSIRIRSNSPEYMALSRFNVSKRQLLIQKVFDDRPLIPGDWPRDEKNWGFFEHDGRLLIMYTALPCTMIFEYYPGEGQVSEMLSEKCYAEVEDIVLANTGLRLDQAHLSGHPVMWQSSGDPSARSEYLVMVHSHASHPSRAYQHWLLRMNATSATEFDITHVSEGAVFGSATLHALDGHMPDVLVVGSYSVNRHYLSIFGGMGDKHPIYERIDLAQVAWLNLMSSEAAIHRD